MLVNGLLKEKIEKNRETYPVLNFELLVLVGYIGACRHFRLLLALRFQPFIFLTVGLADLL